MLRSIITITEEIFQKAESSVYVTTYNKNLNECRVSQRVCLYENLQTKVINVTSIRSILTCWITKTSLFTVLCVASSISWSYLAQFSARARKNKKNPPRKKFLIFQAVELSSSNIEKFHEMEDPPKNSLCFRKRNSEKASYTSGNETFQSTTKKFLVF